MIDFSHWQNMRIHSITIQYKDESNPVVFTEVSEEYEYQPRVWKKQSGWFKPDILVDNGSKQKAFERKSPIEFIDYNRPFKVINVEYMKIDNGGY